MMKLWELVIEIRLRRNISISENHFGCVLGRVTIEAGCSTNNRCGNSFSCGFLFSIEFY